MAIPVPQLRSMITAESQRQGVDPAVPLAIAFGGEGATSDTSAVSPKGAAGVFQLMPGTAKEMDVTDVNDPAQNIRGGVGYIKKLMGLFPGSLEKVAAAFHAGPGAVQRAGGIPDTEDGIISTRGYVQKVLNAHRKESGAAPSPSPRQDAPVTPYRQAVQQSIAARDPRQAVIDEGLRIMGKTRESFGTAFTDPDFVDNFYRATRQRAEGESDTLNLTSTNADYLNVLTKIPGPTKPGEPAPSTTPTPEQPGIVKRVAKDIGSALTTNLLDTTLQTVRGITVDPVAGVLQFAQDLGTLANKKLGPAFGGFTASSEDPQLGQTLQKYVDDIIGQPETGTSATLRALAGFVAPFLQVSKGLEAAGMVGRVGKAVAAEGITNTVFIDPDSPMIMDMIDSLARGIDPKDPNSIRSTLVRYIAGEGSDNDVAKKFAERGLRVVENAPLTALVEGALSAVKFLRANKTVKNTVMSEADMSPPPLKSVSNAGAVDAERLKGMQERGPAGGRAPGMPGVKGKAEAQALADETKVNKAVTPVADQVEPITDVPATVVEKPPAGGREPGIPGVKGKADAKALADETAINKSVTPVVDQIEPLTDATATVAEKPPAGGRQPGFPGLDRRVKAIEKPATQVLEGLDEAEVALMQGQAPTPVADMLEGLSGSNQSVQLRPPPTLPQTLVKTAEGTPLKVYHGTNQTFERFDPARQGTRDAGEFSGLGPNFAESPEIASRYATVAPGEAGAANVRPAYLNIKNPLDLGERTGHGDMTGGGAMIPDAKLKILATEVAQLPPEKLAYQQTSEEWFNEFAGGMSAGELHQALGDAGLDERTIAGLYKAMGYDGVTVVESVGPGGKGTKPYRVWIPFDPEQVHPAPQVDAMLSAHEALQHAEELLTNGASTPFITRLTTALEDPTNQKIALAALLRGSISGMVATELSEPTGTEAANESTSDKNTRRLAVFLTAAGLAAAPKAIRLAKQLRTSLDSTAAQSLSELRLSPPVRSTYGITRFVDAIKAAKVEGPEAIAERLRPALRMVDDPQDLKDLITQTETMFPQAAQARERLLNTPLSVIDEKARQIGADPKEVAKFLRETTDPLHFSSRMDALVALTKSGVAETKDLARRFFEGDPSAAQPFLKQFAVTGELARGFQMGRSDFGRGLNILKQAADGRIMTAFAEGPMAGSHVATQMDAMRLARWVLELPDEAVSAAARKATDPNWRTAWGELLVNTLLMTPRTAVKTTLGNLARIGTELVIREAGALEGQMWRLMGYEVPQGTPVLAEPFVMMYSLGQNVAGSLRAAAHTIVTGETTALEHGTARTFTTAPQFVRGAFPNVAAGLDAAGSLVGFPNAGNVIDAIGAFSRGLAGRGLLAADEMAQYLTHAMELDAHAYRAAAYQTFESGEARAAFLADFKANPPARVMEEITRQKRMMSYMNDLFDERGGFKGLRQMLGMVNSAKFESAVARVQLPFIRSATNMLTTGMELTPGLNLLSSTFRAELTSADPIVRAAAQGRLWAGVGFAGLAATLGATGVVTGQLSTDKALREELTRAGREPNAVHIGGLAIPIDTKEPLGFIFSAFAGIGAAAGGESTPAEMGAAQSALTAFMDLVAHAPVAEALGRVLTAFDENKVTGSIKKSGMGETVAQTLDAIFLQSYVPPHVWQDIVRIVEPHKRVYDSFWQEVQNRAGFYEGSKVETDIFGRPRFVGGGVDTSQLNNAVRFFFPARIDPIVVDPVDKALAEKGVVVHDPRGVISQGPIDLPLQRSEVQRLKEIMAHPPGGVPLYQKVKELTESPFWKTATPGPDGTADLMVQKIVRAYTTGAHRFLLAENRELREKIKAKGQSNGFLPLQ